jgi:sulfate permease, SulP family
MSKKLEPKLVTVLREGYSRKQFSSDLVAGVIVGIVALPLAIAFAIASGVKPEQGVFTAVVAGFIAAALSGSRAQITGPTGAFIVIVYGIVQQYGYNGLALATLIAGVLLIVMGLTGMGGLLRFIPYPLTIGFTSAIALIILSSQIRDFFGLQLQHVPAEFIAKWIAYAQTFHTLNVYALLVGVGSLLIILFWPRVTHKIPGSLIAILVLTAAVQLFKLPVETIGARFGSVPNHLPHPHLPPISWALTTKLFSPAITIALLGAIESLLSAVVADGMQGTRHRSNMELVAQGAANILSPLFTGIPATGAIARTATNIKNGGRTPVSGLVHAITLIFIMLFFGKWAALIPMPTLAAILIFVAYNMSEWQTFLQTLRSPKSDIAVLFATFLLTVFIDLTVAIEVGVVLAALLFLQRMANVTQVRDLVEEEDPYDPKAAWRAHVPESVEVFEIYGSLFFAAVDQFKDAMRRVEKTPRILILRMRHVLAMDASGMKAIEDLYEKLKKEKAVLILSGVHAQPLVVMGQTGFLDRIDEKNLQPDIEHALKRANKILGLPLNGSSDSLPHNKSLAT